MAANLRGDSHTDLLLLDVTTLSLGVDTIGNFMNIVIPRITPIPTKEAQVYSTTKDNQTFINIKVKEKDLQITISWGKFRVSGIPCAPKGVSNVKEIFEIDADDIHTVTAEILSTGMTKKLVITNANESLSKEEIEKIVKDGER
ncbi:putative Heat shock protein 70 family [Helianthus anomalus]